MLCGRVLEISGNLIQNLTLAWHRHGGTYLVKSESIVLGLLLVRVGVTGGEGSLTTRLLSCRNYILIFGFFVKYLSQIV